VNPCGWEESWVANISLKSTHWWFWDNGNNSDLILGEYRWVRQQKAISQRLTQFFHAELDLFLQLTIFADSLIRRAVII